ncbi:MAG TPA: allantoate amidohydrolase [Actinospica sp.]|jgi:allantoate deiminase|nr:allantoate amidohydrolase [Actinospica sp.]
MSARTVLERCDELALISALPDGLIERTYLTVEHKAANAAVAQWMTDAGLATWQDAAGNVCGRREGARPGLPALLLGSHLDTVPQAGRYDGILGVLIAVEVAARITASGAALPFALEVVGFGDEEGTRFGATLLGSRALAGTWDPAWWSLTDADGVSLREAYAAFGLDPEAITRAARRPQDVVGYLEAHIEQGPVLEDRGRALGLVSSIAGARRTLITITGRAAHAGTPYPLRRDALAGAAEAITLIESLAPDLGLIATVGRVGAQPGAVNVVAGSATFSLDLRAASDEQRDTGLGVLLTKIDKVCERRGLSVSAEQTHVAETVHCDPGMKAALAAAVAAAEEGEPLELFSPPGHDAMAVAALTRVGMLFVRCAGGVSHHPEESVNEADVALAIDALHAAVLNLAGEYGTLAT